MTDAPQLKYEEVRAVDCHDLDAFVAIHLESYGVTWRALDTDRDTYHNGSPHTVRIKFGEEIEDDFDQDFNNWLLGGAYYKNDAFLNDTIPGIQEMMQWLCNTGKLPEATYVVELWW